MRQSNDIWKLYDSRHPLRLHSVTLKAALFCGTEPWAIKKRNAQKLEAAQTRFVRRLLGFKIPDFQENSNIQNRLK